MPGIRQSGIFDGGISDSRKRRSKPLPLTLTLSPRKGGERGRGGVHQERGNPRGSAAAYDGEAPPIEGRSMEACQVVRAGLQLGRGYAIAARGLPVAA
jgi:hypothetical protein